MLQQLLQWNAGLLFEWRRVNELVLGHAHIEQLRISGTDEPSEQILPGVRRARGRGELTGLTTTDEWYVADRGKDITDDLIAGPPGYRNVEETRADSTVGDGDRRVVFVVHGRDSGARKAMFDFLRALSLEPLEWEQAVRLTGESSPYIGQVLDAGFAHARAAVVLLTGDDEARLREHLRNADELPQEVELTPQPRPNVLFEAGMALGKYPKRTIFVQIGRVRPMSDLDGRHMIRFSDTAEGRNDLKVRLQGAGLLVNDSGKDWLRAGDFQTASTGPSRKPARKSDTNTTTRVRAEVVSEGIRWTWAGSYDHSGRASAIASCPTHPARLLFRNNQTQRVVELHADFKIGTKSDGMLFCPDDGGHVMSFTESLTVGEATMRASALLTQKVREYLSSNQQ